MRRFLFLALTVALAACSPSVEVTPLGTLPAVAPSATEVQVFTNPGAIGRPYREVALLTAEDDWGTNTEGEMVALLIAEARRLGADGLILLGQETQSSGGVYNPVGDSLYYSEFETAVVRASAFVFTDQGMGVIAPGMAVARRVETAPGSLALGRVTADGTSVIWHEIVDHEGRPASAFGGMCFSRIAKPLRGNEIPCPHEFAALIP